MKHSEKFLTEKEKGIRLRQQIGRQSQNTLLVYHERTEKAR